MWSSMVVSTWKEEQDKRKTDEWKLREAEEELLCSLASRLHCRWDSPVVSVSTGSVYGRGRQHTHTTTTDNAFTHSLAAQRVCAAYVHLLRLCTEPDMNRVGLNLKSLADNIEYFLFYFIFTLCLGVQADGGLLFPSTGQELASN